MNFFKALLYKIVFGSIILLNLIAKGQENHKLSGRITDCKWKTGIPKTTIRLISNNGINVEVLSDSLGYYYFNDSVLKPNSAYVLSTRSPSVYQDEIQTKSRCPYSPCYSNKEYLNSSDKVKFKTNDSLQYKNYIYDFCLVEMLKCGWTIPEINFIKNSTDFNLKKTNYPFEYYNNYTSDTAFDCISDLLICNPSFVIEISGHADKKEKNTTMLSEARAKKVYEMLIKKGIEKDRLHYKGYGSSQPLEKRDDIGNTIAYLKGNVNQRVSIILLSRDYNLQSKKTSKTE